jgi:hypothetical protein
VVVGVGIGAVLLITLSIAACVVYRRRSQRVGLDVRRKTSIHAHGTNPNDTDAVRNGSAAQKLDGVDAENNWQTQVQGFKS